MTARIRFENVGARKLTWDCDVDLPLSEEALIREVRKSGALMSRGIEISEENEEHGAIFVGLVRRVGTWRVLHVTTPSEPAPVLLLMERREREVREGKFA